MISDIRVINSPKGSQPTSIGLGALTKEVLGTNVFLEKIQQNIFWYNSRLEL